MVAARNAFGQGLSKQEVQRAVARILAGLPSGTPPELAAAIAETVARTLERHGPAAFAMPRGAACAHESAHAIVGAHEQFLIRQVTVFSLATPLMGIAWGGCCLDATGWTTGPETSAAADLRCARMIVAGLAGEAMTGLEKPGSSIDEVALSQMIALNVAVKLAGGRRSDAELHAFAQRLWRRAAWGGALAILRANREPFEALVRLLDRKERAKGKALREILARVKRRPGGEEIAA